MTTSVEKKVNGTPLASVEPRFEYDPVRTAEAEAIRTAAQAKADAERIKAQGEAEAAKALAREQAEKERIANERAAMRLEKEKADHAAHLAKKAAETAKARAEEEKAVKAEQDQAAEEAQRAAEQQRSERLWKWGARGIYAVGMAIAAPVQFIHFWDPERKFLISAPVFLEGIALVLAAGAAWAVANRRDVLPYRIGIMLSAVIAAGVNMYGGLTDQRIGMNAGIIGALASLGGPIVLMAYEHGIAQQTDGIPSRRERRATRRAKAREDAAKAKAKAEKQAAEKAAADAKAEQQRRADEEQKRRDTDRENGHQKVWAVADSLRSARGSQYVTEQIWAEAWYRVTGSKVVGITAEIEALSRAATERMKAATDSAENGDSAQVESQMAPRAKRDPDAPDGRRFNGGTPPIRRAGDTAPYVDVAKKQAAIEQTSRTDSGTH